MTANLCATLKAYLLTRTRLLESRWAQLDSTQKVPSTSSNNSERPSFGLIFVRYGIGVAMVIAGFVMIGVNPGGFGVDGFAMAAGGGLSVLLINLLFRLGVSGDRDREREEAARRYFDEHGRWPDEQHR